MVVVLCNSFDEAKEGFYRFLNFLQENEPIFGTCISKVFKHSYCIETDDDLRYIFVDHRLQNLFYGFDKPDIIEIEEFFEGIEELYVDTWYGF